MLDPRRLKSVPLWILWLPTITAWGQGTHCDPQKVITAAGCIQCHAQAESVWRQTPHHTTFDTLYKKPEARQIADKMGVVSIKRGDLCIKCHFTQIEREDGSFKPVSGVSCESCHGAAKDWVSVHNDYGGPGATRQSESDAHKQMRLETARRLGMRNPHNLYDMAQSCLACHTIGHEELVNVGGHSAGSLDFEMVAWSQGSMRHNFLRTDGKFNAESDPERLKVMWVAGLIADLEFSTRAVGRATKKDKFGLTVAKRAADKSLKLYEIQQSLQDPHLDTILQAFAQAELKINNESQLMKIADQIEAAGRKFAAETDGQNLKALDALLPSKDQYK